MRTVIRHVQTSVNSFFRSSIIKEGMSSWRKNLTSQALLLLFIGAVIGALIILGVRFASYRPERTHYHANFAVYINGQREAFTDPAFYEESGAACSEEAQMTPHERAHLHDNVNDVVHVEDQAVTWGQFFTNLGWIVDAKLIQTPSLMYVADQDHKISFILNGEKTDNVSNRVIGDRDKLLVDFAGSQENINKAYADIPSSAQKYNLSKDPATCGAQGSPSTRERLRHLF